jgi:hypothetical protein
VHERNIEIDLLLLLLRDLLTMVCGPAHPSHTMWLPALGACAPVVVTPHPPVPRQRLSLLY